MTLARMQTIATGLLVAMALIFLAARAAESMHPALGFLRAFAEAGMVGALADWFAVVALFRHPLGLPIPHTAIIARNKDRIGGGLAKFVAENFLASDVIAARLAATDLAGALARWLADPVHRELFASRTTRFVPSILAALDDQDIRGLVHDAFARRLARIELAPLAGEILEVLAAHERHQPLVDDLLLQASTLIKDYEPDIRDRVRENTAWLWQRFGVDEKVSDKLIAAVEATLEELAADPAHAWRAKIDDAVRRFARELKESPQRRAEGEALKAKLLAHPALVQYLGAVWSDLRAELIADAARPDSTIKARLGEIAESIAEYVLGDDTVRRKLNRMLRAVLVELIDSRRDEVAQLIAETVRKWDAETLSAKIEAEVGKDLQYIRINGTVIGGLVGLVLHAVSKLLPA